MKKLWNVLVLTLAVNFLALAGVVGWLRQEGRLDREKIEAIKAVLFPPTTQPTVQLAENTATTRPVIRLEEMLAKYAGKPPAEQLEYIRQSFDSQMVQLERAQRGLLDLQRQVELAQQKLDGEKAGLEEQRKKLAAQEQESQRLAADKGFQDTLALYQSLPAKQAKAVFMGMDDQTAVKYLQAMEPRAVAKITKEFKSAEETERLKKLMEKMRPAQASTKE